MLLVDIECFGSTKLVQAILVHDVQLVISLYGLRQFRFLYGSKVIVTDGVIVVDV